MLALASLLTIAVAVSATVLPVRPERKIADAEFLKKQKQVLDLLVGVANNEQFKSEYADWDIAANFGAFTDPKYPREFLEAYHRGFLPRDAILSFSNHKARADVIKLFDVFYFAKDFDTFYKAAVWARNHVHPGMFASAYVLAFYHRADLQNFYIPPFYEIYPNFFVPTETFHKVFKTKMSGVKERVFNYNNTGYEYNPYGSRFGSIWSTDNKGHAEYRISYFREDVGLNAFFSDWFFRNPTWMTPEKYSGENLAKKGENFYYTLKQIFARYNLERISNGLPFPNIITWTDPIKVGYNPRLSYPNGRSFFFRPDNVVPFDNNNYAVSIVDQLERRFWDVVDSGNIYEPGNQTSIPLDKHNGIELLGRLIYGTAERPSGKFYKSLYYAGIRSLAYLLSTGSDKSFVGNALSTPMTELRDPVWYNHVARILVLFQHYKRSLGYYTKDDFVFRGVKIDNVEVDKLLTYFDHFDYEATNGVPMEQSDDYTSHKYTVRQYRLNHKPFRYNITVKSNEVSGNALVRVFIGPKYDSDDRVLSFDQAQMAYFEIDRFPVKLSSGINVFERSSSESPIFVDDQQGFRSLYTSINSALSQEKQFYVSKAGRCGFPDRLQLPMGWKGGLTYVMGVMITPYEHSQAGDDYSADIACGGSKLYDSKHAMGFPFDRPAYPDAFQVPNFYFKDIHIHHKEPADVQKPSA
uniref:Cyanoprotein alpha subunit n=1 Tax=Riptortus clavatus TaxID=41704 RepID=Q94728_RIPCL|nr:cyanoprotein alpha subunit precursor [Riptortus clavatus]